MIQKTAEATHDLIGNKTADKITKVPKHSQQNNLQTITNENDKEKPNSRRKTKNYWWSEIKITVQ